MNAKKRQTNNSSQELFTGALPERTRGPNKNRPPTSVMTVNRVSNSNQGSIADNPPAPQTIA